MSEYHLLIGGKRVAPREYFPVMNPLNGLGSRFLTCERDELVLQRWPLGHLLAPDNLKVDQAKRRWRCRRCGRARAAEFRARHKPAT